MTKRGLITAMLSLLAASAAGADASVRPFEMDTRVRPYEMNARVRPYELNIAGAGDESVVVGADPRVGPHDQTAQNTGIAVLLRRLEQVVQAGNAAAYLTLLTDSADRARVRDFSSAELMSGATRAVIQERDRQPLPGTLPDNGYSLLVDALDRKSTRLNSSH